jgi:hypothetical protein
VVATHARTSSDPEVFVERDGIVYELFVSTLPSPALTAADILELYLHRGSVETVLADPRQGARDGSLVLPYPVWPGICPDPRSMGLERIERALGQQLSPSELRTTEFAPAHEAEPLAQPMSLNLQQHRLPQSRMVHRNGLAHRLRMGFLAPHLRRNPMEASVALPTIRSISRARRPERDGTLRLLYAARIGHCRACPLRAQCQESSTTLGPRRKSRGALAALLFSRRILAGTSPNPCSPFFYFGALARLATLQHPANLAESSPQPNGLPGQLCSTLSTTRPLLHREDPYPSGARAISGFPGTSVWHAMLVQQMLPGSSSRFMDSQPPLLLPLALISWPLPNQDIVSTVLFLASRSSDLATVLVLRLFSYQCSC